MDFRELSEAPLSQVCLLRQEEPTAGGSDSKIVDFLTQPASPSKWVPGQCHHQQCHSIRTSELLPLLGEWLPHPQVSKVLSEKACHPRLCQDSNLHGLGQYRRWCKGLFWSSDWNGGSQQVAQWHSPSSDREPGALGVQRRDGSGGGCAHLKESLQRRPLQGESTTAGNKHPKTIA